MIAITIISKTQSTAGIRRYTIHVKTQNQIYNNKTNLYDEEILQLIYPVGYINSMAHRT